MGAFFHTWVGSFWREKNLREENFENSLASIIAHHYNNQATCESREIRLGS